MTEWLMQDGPNQLVATWCPKKMCRAAHGATKSILMPIRNFAKALERDKISRMESLSTTSLDPVSYEFLHWPLTFSWTALILLELSADLPESCDCPHSGHPPSCWASPPPARWHRWCPWPSPACWLSAGFPSGSPAPPSPGSASDWPAGSATATPALELNCKSTKAAPKLNSTQLLISWCDEPHSHSQQYLPRN